MTLLVLRQDIPFFAIYKQNAIWQKQQQRERYNHDGSTTPSTTTCNAALKRKGDRNTKYYYYAGIQKQILLTIRESNHVWKWYVVLSECGTKLYVTYKKKMNQEL